MLDITAFIILILAIAGIVYIIYKKVPLLKEAKLEDLEKEKNAKYALLEKRLIRKVGIAKSFLKRLPFSKASGSVNNKFKKIYDKVQNKKQVLKSEKKKEKVNDEINDDTAAQDKVNPLQQALSLIKQAKFKQAENLIIEEIKSSPKSIKAYEVLSDIYLGAKNYVHAEATLEHIITLSERLKKTRAMHYLNLAKAKLHLEKLDEALQQAKNAITLEPSNPKILHFLVKVCVKCKQKNLAWKYYRELKKCNGNSEGLDELLDELKTL